MSQRTPIPRRDGSSRGGRADSDERRGGAAAKRPRDASSERAPPVAAVPAGPVMSSADIGEPHGGDHALMSVL